MKRLTWFFLLICTSASLNENDFPEGFMFGTATSAYQTEGAWNVSGKGESSWDRFAHQNPHLIMNGSNGDVACDSYNKLEEDVQLIKNLKADYYRFSLSWSRILPEGLSYKVNPDGIRYYNRLIDLLITNNVTPFVTLYHWDTPQKLQDLGGFANELMIEWFEQYARVVFENFGDRVKWWLTINEPFQLCRFGYGEAGMAPGYNSSGIGEYLCAHNVLKAHARAYHLYKTEFAKNQTGHVSIALDTEWFIPKTESPEDIEAAERGTQFVLGWFADPIFHPSGDYPLVMKNFIRERSKKEGFKNSRFPQFTLSEIELIKGSADFFALNHYTSRLTEDIPDEPIDVPSWPKDTRLKPDIDLSWPKSAAHWLQVVPEGLTNMLKWIKDRYGDIDIFIMENGYADNGEIDDQGRINYFNLYMRAALDAIHTHNISVKSFTAWSLLDNFEWGLGYTNRFGLHHVDFNDPKRKRTPKASSAFIKSVFSIIIILLYF